MAPSDSALSSGGGLSLAGRRGDDLRGGGRPRSGRVLLFGGFPLTPGAAPLALVPGRSDGATWGRRCGLGEGLSLSRSGCSRERGPGLPRTQGARARALRRLPLLPLLSLLSAGSSSSECERAGRPQGRGRTLVTQQRLAPPRQPHPRRRGRPRPRTPSPAPTGRLYFFQRTAKAGEANRFAPAAGGHAGAVSCPAFPGHSRPRTSRPFLGGGAVRCPSSGRGRSPARSTSRALRPPRPSPGLRCFPQHRFRVRPAPGDETGAGEVGVSALGAAVRGADRCYSDHSTG